MKKIITASLLIFLLGPLCSCDKDEVYYQAGDRVEATFLSATLQVPALTEADNGKVTIPLYRGNKKGAASVPVGITGGGGIFIPDKTSFDFAPGENVAYIDFNFDYDALGGKPEPVSITIRDENMLALNGIARTTFSLVRKLTYSKAGTGMYYSYFFDQTWTQTLYKAQEGNFYRLNDCWVKGTDFTFEIKNGTIDWHTLRPGYNYGSYGPVAWNIKNKKLGKIGGKPALVLTVQYYLPQYHNVVLKEGEEYFIFPDGFSFD